jgi:hypothetical protein
MWYFGPSDLSSTPAWVWILAAALAAGMIVLALLGASFVIPIGIAVVVILLIAAVRVSDRFRSEGGLGEPPHRGER